MFRFLIYHIFVEVFVAISSTITHKLFKFYFLFLNQGAEKMLLVVDRKLYLYFIMQ